MNKAELKRFLSDNFDFGKWKTILDMMFSKIDYLNRAVEIETQLAKKGEHVGNIRLDDGRSLALFVIHVSDNIVISRNRKSLREIAAKYIDQNIIHGALVFYYSQNQDDYRMTFVAKQTFFNENGELIKKETAPKRYTFLLGKNEACTTAASRLMGLIEAKQKKETIFLSDVVDAFSVERLNKEFFNGYKAQYAKFLKLLEDKKQHRDYVKKMLGRLVFLQFLQKKGWMGVPATNINWEGGDRNYLTNLIAKYKGNDRILSDVLEPLFFDTLNKERVGDIADSRLGDNIKIPYLNGGLFDKDKTDALDIDFPYSYFEELMEFFNEYNFTIDENDPDDAEVGVDPEMLGHIFENLLEDNKDKGAFYTPKEIVQYMCRQSVIQYLKTHEADEKYSLAIERLINESLVDSVLQNKEAASRFVALLRNVKVCDPAIGSGAFPMGILYVLYYAIHHLQSHAEPNKSFDSTQTKRDIIQNNIFGVDIEQGAVDIARLRFWLALVVDADEPQPLPNLDYKITCGNSLLNRYDLGMPLDDVFVEYNKNKKGDERLSLEKYKQIVREYTNTSNHEKKELFRKTIEDIKKTFKTELSKKEIDKIVYVKKRINDIEIPSLFGDKLTQEKKSALKKWKVKLEKLETERANILNNKVYEDAFEWRFEFPQLLDENGNFTGFDIVIGNPPYIQIKWLEEKDVYKDHGFKTYDSTGDIYCLFYERGIELLNGNGSLTYITSNKWLKSNYGKLTRRYIVNNSTPVLLIDLGSGIFEHATVDTNIIIIQNTPNENVLTKVAILEKDLSNLTFSDYKFKEDDIWSIINLDITSVRNKIDGIKTRISDFNVELCYGILTGANKVFILSKEKADELIQLDENNREIIKPILRGRDLDRYYAEFKNVYLLCTHNGVKSENIPPINIHKDYPTLIPYFDSFGNEFYNRGEQGDNYYNLRNCAYINKYARPKILYADIVQDIGKFYYDEDGYYTNDTAFMITGENLEYLLGILNSKAFTFFYKNFYCGGILGNKGLRYKRDYLLKVPIPFGTKEDQQLLIDKVVRINGLKRTNKESDTSELENQIDFHVYKLYGLTYDEVVVIDPETPITREEYEQK